MKLGVSGYIYEVLAEENQVIPFKNIPCARLATEPVKVTNCVRVENAYDLFNVYYINKEERQQWLKRAQTDKKADFVAILSE